ncbi:unnamed protein product [Gadus morhua 'NCC']
MRLTSHSHPLPLHLFVPTPPRSRPGLAGASPPRPSIVPDFGSGPPPQCDRPPALREGPSLWVALPEAGRLGLVRYVRTGRRRDTGWKDQPLSRIEMCGYRDSVEKHAPTMKRQKAKVLETRRRHDMDRGVTGERPVGPGDMNQRTARYRLHGLGYARDGGDMSSCRWATLRCVAMRQLSCAGSSGGGSTDDGGPSAVFVLCNHRRGWTDSQRPPEDPRSLEIRSV